MPRAGDNRAAASFYRAALRVAAGARPSAIARRRAAPGRGGGAAIERDFQAHLEARLRARRAPGRTRAAAVQTRSTSCSAGRRSISSGRASFYFPACRRSQYLRARRSSPGLAAVEAATAGHPRRARGAAGGRSGDFRPYVERRPGPAAGDFHGLLGDPSWTAFYLWKDGALVEENAARCPAHRRRDAAGAAAGASGSRTPTVLFSLLRPGAHIPPHTRHAQFPADLPPAADRAARRLAARRQRDPRLGRGQAADLRRQRRA